MVIYHSGLTAEALLKYQAVFPDYKPYVMLSYGRPTAENNRLCVKYRDSIGGVALDSGAWTLNASKKNPGVNINVHSYALFLGQMKELYDFYLNLDSNFKKDGFKENWANQRYLEKRGLFPVPVIHNWDGEEADFYIQKGYSKVAVGSGELRGGKVDILRPKVERLVDAGVSIHFLGSAQYDLLAYLPVESCDVSTIEQAGGRGYILYWNRNKTTPDQTESIFMEDRGPLTHGRLYYTDYPEPGVLDSHLATLGLTYQDLMGRNWEINRMIVNLHYYRELEMAIRAKRRDLGI